jgi:uncharacterized membrane protein YphA (DoxX/SURF4 family)
MSRMDRSGWRDFALLAFRFGMAAVFITAALPKIAAPDLFAGNIHNYKLLPAWGVNLMALVLPWLELFIGLGLAFGIASRAAVVTMAGLMCVFIVAYISARARGLDVACGCFEVGEHAKAQSLVWIVLRDVAMLAATLALVRFGTGPSPWAFLRRFGGGPPSTGAPPNAGPTPDVSELSPRRKARAGVRLR